MGKPTISKVQTECCGSDRESDRERERERECGVECGVETKPRLITSQSAQDRPDLLTLTTFPPYLSENKHLAGPQ